MPGNIMGPTAEAVVNAAITYPLSGASGDQLSVMNVGNMSLLGRMLKQLKIIALHLSLITDEEIKKSEVS